MPAPVYHLSFRGYWRESNKGGVPAERGIFCVYTCVFNPAEKKVTLDRLVYVGAAENAREGIAAHPAFTDWKAHLKPGQELCFTYAPVTGEMEHIRSTLVSRSKPALNEQPAGWQPMEHVTVEGATALLEP